MVIFLSLVLELVIRGAELFLQFKNMEDIYIFGASGYARETALINQEIGKYTLKAFC